MSQKDDTRVVRPVYGPTNPSPEEFARMKVKRFASVIGLNREKEQYYRILHSGTWTPVLERLRKSNIGNFSIYVTELAGKKYLFSYFEYTGNDYEKDMADIAKDPITQRWWQETDPCQLKLPNRAKPDDNWSQMEMVFLDDPKSKL
mmetsp:Transcript_9891/g.15855  ORF Transcript_9891/g.15855 Transcript_9891/m.15855 type:complete len:146 (-) Transcript_9891:266-703(-)